MWLNGSDVEPYLGANARVLRFRLEQSHGAVDVLFDGHRVWSFDVQDQQVDEDGVRETAWPAPLAERLEGVATVALRLHGDTRALVSARCEFGASRDPVDLTDEYGRLLSLSKWGRLNQSFADIDSESLEWYLDMTDEVLTVLREELGRPAFLAYGTLLGAVRSHHFIGHDMDVDLAYLSAAATPVDAMLESYAIERCFRSKGWAVRRQNDGFLQLFFEQPLGGWRNLDVFTMFVDPEGPTLYGINDTRLDAGADAILPLGTVELEGRRFPVPQRAEDLLAAAYGPGWRVPDPNFEYGMTPGKRQMRQWFGGYREDHDRWTRLYRSRPEVVPRTPTAFATWLESRLSDVDAVVDAGSGMGRDTHHYARLSPAAVGMDASGSGVRRATRRATRMSNPAVFELVNFGVLRQVLPSAALVVHRYPGRRLVVARHLLDAMSRSAYENFMGFCSVVARGGGEVAVEFCTDVGAKEFVEFPGMPKRGLRARRVAADLRASGGVVRLVEEFDGPEGATCRMTATWQ